MITDEAEFWRTRSARPLLGEGRQGIERYAAIPDDLAASLDLESVTGRREDGQWLVKSGESMLVRRPVRAFIKPPKLAG